MTRDECQEALGAAPRATAADDVRAAQLATLLRVEALLERQGAAAPKPRKRTTRKPISAKAAT